MEEDPDGGSRPLPQPFHDALGLRPIHLLILLWAILGLSPPGQAQTSSPSTPSVLRYGTDMEGGGPFAYIDPANPSRLIGFEVDLMDRLGAELGAQPKLVQCQWDQLLNFLGTGNIDLVINGYELTAPRVRSYRASRPYYVLQMQLLAHQESPIRSWEDLGKLGPDGRRWLVGVLGGTSTETLLRQTYPHTVQIRSYTGATEALLQTSQGKLDATLQDLPAARFYAPRYQNLAFAGEPVGHGYYVLYVRKEDEALAQRIDQALDRLIDSGELRSIYEKYNVWTDAQEDLGRWDELKAAVDADLSQSIARLESGWGLVWTHRDALLRSAAMTILLSVVSMPLAMLIGLGVALGRLYGPAPLRGLLSLYVELIRGTPLMLQLFVLFYLVELPPLAAGIAGLAINYSAYEAEIYRAGLQAIPIGQMEAALALGMTRAQALRRIIVPQAVRLVIPPVTNDFIALFKDSSVCSVVTLVELSKQYQILANSTGGVLEFAVSCALIYLILSVPLSWLSRWSESRLKGQETPGKGVLA